MKKTRCFLFLLILVSFFLLSCKLELITGILGNKTPTVAEQQFDLTATYGAEQLRIQLTAIPLE